MEEQQKGLAEADVRTMDETLSRTELQIEQEKLKLERDRIVLDRERLEAMRDRMKMESELRIDTDGKPSVTISTLVQVSIICLLLGGILGAFSTSIQRDRRSAEHLQAVMKTLTSASSEEIGTVSNGNQSASSGLPNWLKTIKPKGAHEGISLVVVQ